ncbi:hypothetical protein [Streptomyces canus]|uniref:hypothetical protein n=1 Tax=Streptomyces canus TaxID=58343 RepID=UPI00225AB6A3|nr:hypothetical protein [Streptomyces canus]MCX4856620.1 hypothetical protein [Streptomyces canus]
MAVAAQGPAEVISGAAAPGTLFPRGANIGALNIFGIDAVVAYREDIQEIERRASAGAAELTNRRALELLMNLPLDEAIPVDSLSEAERRALRQLPRGSVLRHDGVVVRQATQPMQIDLAVVPGRTWTATKEKAEWFTPFCSRAVLIDGPLRRREDAVMEADFYGIGLLVETGKGVEVIVPPRPFVRRRYTAASWQLVENAYRQLSSGR